MPRSKVRKGRGAQPRLHRCDDLEFVRSLSSDVGVCGDDVGGALGVVGRCRVCKREYHTLMSLAEARHLNHMMARLLGLSVSGVVAPSSKTVN